MRRCRGRAPVQSQDRTFIVSSLQIVFFVVCVQRWFLCLFWTRRGVQGGRWRRKWAPGLGAAWPGLAVCTRLPARSTDLLPLLLVVFSGRFSRLVMHSLLPPPPSGLPPSRHPDSIRHQPGADSQHLQQLSQAPRQGRADGVAGHRQCRRPPHLREGAEAGDPGGLHGVSCVGRGLQPLVAGLEQKVCLP